MKPELRMEPEKPTTVSFQGIVEQQEKPKKRSRLFAGAAIGLVAVVVLATIIGLSVYFGAQLSRNNFKDAMQLYHTDDGKVVEEVTKVTETEVTVKVPNEVETVFDYKNGLEVERFVDSETKVKSACYAKYLNMTTAPTRDADRYGEDEELSLDTSHQEKETTQKWKVTSRQISKSIVSESVAEMCKDTDIFWMEKVDQEGDKEKRAACNYIGYTYICYPRSYACSYYCYLTHYCRTAGGSLYSYKTQNWYCKTGCYPGINNPVCP